MRHVLMDWNEAVRYSNAFGLGGGGSGRVTKSTHVRVSLYRRRGWWYAVCRCGWESEPCAYKHEARAAMEAHAALKMALAGLS